MTAKEQVLAVYPNARCERFGPTHYRITSPVRFLTDSRKTEFAAWIALRDEIRAQAFAEALTK